MRVGEEQEASTGERSAVRKTEKVPHDTPSLRSLICVATGPGAGNDLHSQLLQRSTSAGRHCSARHVGHEPGLARPQDSYVDTLYSEHVSSSLVRGAQPAASWLPSRLDPLKKRPEGGYNSLPLSWKVYRLLSSGYGTPGR